MSGNAGYRSLDRLTMTLQAALVVYALIALVSMWSGWLEIRLLSRAARGEEISDQVAAANDDRQVLVAGTYAIVYLATAVFFLRWTYLACRNARSFGARGMQTTPGWSVGWYFVPIATLWKPYGALKETFMASHPGSAEDWSRAPFPALMPLWWTLWLASSALGRAGSRLSTRAETADELLLSSWTTFASDALDVPLAVVVILMASTMRRWQSERSQLAAASVFD